MDQRDHPKEFGEPQNGDNTKNMQTTLKKKAKDKAIIKGEMLVSIYDTQGAIANMIEKEIEALVSGPRFAGYRKRNRNNRNIC